MYYLARLEETAFSIWMRESEWGFFSALVMHSLAMGLVVGINLAVALRVLGMAPNVPLSLMVRFYPIMRVAAIIILLSGLLLLLAYPAKGLTNPVLYLKLFGVLAALWIARYFRLRLMADNSQDFVAIHQRHKLMAMAVIPLWFVSVGAGRFLAYTHGILLASSFY